MYLPSRVLLTLFESNQALMTFLVHWYAFLLPYRDLYLMGRQFLRSQNLPPYVPSIAFLHFLSVDSEQKKMDHSGPPRNPHFPKIRWVYCASFVFLGI